MTGNKLIFKRIVPFMERVINTYGYQFKTPLREIAATIGGVSYVTAMSYFNLLCKLGCIEKQMSSRKHGVTYQLKKRKIDSLIESAKITEIYNGILR